MFSQVFERLVFNTLFNFYFQNKLFTPCQSGVIPGDYCVSKLLSITHETYQSFDCHHPTDIRGTFLDISKAFDKVGHESLVFKLKTYSIDGKLLKLLGDYLTDLQQRVVLKGQMSSWQNIYAGVPQGPVLGPLLFLIYINNLPAELSSRCKIFARSVKKRCVRSLQMTHLFFLKVNDKGNSNTKLNPDLAKIRKWAFP